MSLQITKEERENRELLLTIEVDKARVDQELRKAARKVASNYRIPGFRQGKAPFHVIAQQVGMEALYSEFLEKLGDEVYRTALEQEGLEPYARGALEDVTLDPLTYKLVMPMDPAIDLGNYRDLRVEETVPEVAEAAVEAQLERYRDQHAELTDVDRPSQYGDMMNINVRSVIAPEEADGEEIIVFDENDWDVTPDEKDQMDPPGFDEALLGLAPGDEKEFDLSWPAENQSVHAGKTAHFQVTVNGIKAQEKPALDDEFAQLIGPDFETIDALKESIRESIRTQMEAEAQNAYLAEVLDKLLEQSQLRYPAIVVEDQIDSMLNDIQMQLRRFGIEDMDFYYRQTGQKPEEMRESLREDATKQAERNLIISEVLQAESLTISDEELEARIGEMTQEGDTEESKQLAAFLRNESGRAVLESQLLRDKAIERILAIARGQADALDEAAAQAAQAAAMQANDAAATGESTDNATAADGSHEDAAATDDTVADDTAADHTVAQE